MIPKKYPSKDRNGNSVHLGYLIKSYLVNNPKLGCRFITVDAYANAVDFYRKNDFEFFTMLDTLEPTRLMFFDLKPFKKQLELE